MSLLSVVESLDHVYERVVTDPTGVNDGDLLSWVGDALSVPTDGLVTNSSSLHVENRRDAHRMATLAAKLLMPDREWRR